jgi:hypothetical protein
MKIARRIIKKKKKRKRRKYLRRLRFSRTFSVGYKHILNIKRGYKKWRFR